MSFSSTTSNPWFTGFESMLVYELKTSILTPWFSIMFYDEHAFWSIATKNLPCKPSNAIFHVSVLDTLVLNWPTCGHPHAMRLEGVICYITICNVQKRHLEWGDEWLWGWKRLFISEGVILGLDTDIPPQIRRLKGTIPANSSKLYLPIFLVDDVLDMPSGIYDSIWDVLLLFVWVKTLSTHYQGAVLLTKSLFVYIFIHTQDIIFISPYVWK